MDDMISVIIPSYNAPKNYLETLYNSLLDQTYENFEVLISDDCSVFNHYDEIIKDPRFRIVYRDKNAGPGAARNTGLDEAKGKYIFFTDTDCELHKDTLNRVKENLDRNYISMGNTITKTKSYLGKSIAFMGFPGGGIIGFHNVWKVDEKGYAQSITGCNMAFRKEVFDKVGKFDLIPVAGGEDTIFGKRVIEQGYKIKYDPLQIIYHVERGQLKSFIKWQITRGKGNYYIKKQLGNVKGFLKLRVWSVKNSVLKSGFAYALPVIVLWITGIVCQIIGYSIEKNNNQ